MITARGGTARAAALATLLTGCVPDLPDGCPEASSRAGAICVPDRFADPCDLDRDRSTAARCGGPDCDDSNPAVRPGAVESCDGRDDDCDGFTDEGATTRYHRDADDDGHGDPAVHVDACAPPPGHVEPAGDCDDGNRLVGPGAVEACDGRDDDCDGFTDEGATTRYYRDADEDGYGDSADYVDACSPQTGRVLRPFDCNDRDPLVRPDVTAFAATPTAGGGYDWDCDGIETPEFPYGLNACDACIEPGGGWIDRMPACGEEGTLLVCGWSSGLCFEIRRSVTVQRCR